MEWCIQPHTSRSMAISSTPSSRHADSESSVTEQPSSRREFGGGPLVIPCHRAARRRHETSLCRRGRWERCTDIRSTFRLNCSTAHLCVIESGGPKCSGLAALQRPTLVVVGHHLSPWAEELCRPVLCTASRRRRSERQGSDTGQKS
jgi:hypothetical protein